MEKFVAQRKGYCQHWQYPSRDLHHEDDEAVSDRFISNERGSNRIAVRLFSWARPIHRMRRH